MTCAFRGVDGLVVVAGCVAPVLVSVLVVDGVLDVVVPETPPTGTGRLPSFVSPPPHAVSKRTPASTAAGRARLRTGDVPSGSSGSVSCWGSRSASWTGSPTASRSAYRYSGTAPEASTWGWADRRSRS